MLWMIWVAVMLVIAVGSGLQVWWSLRTLSSVEEQIEERPS